MRNPVCFLHIVQILPWHEIQHITGFIIFSESRYKNISHDGKTFVLLGYELSPFADVPCTACGTAFTARSHEPIWTVVQVIHQSPGFKISTANFSVKLLEEVAKPTVWNNDCNQKRLQQDFECFVIWDHIKDQPHWYFLQISCKC